MKCFIIALALLILALLVLIILIDRITVRAARSLLGALKSARLAWCGVMGVLEVFEMSSDKHVIALRSKQATDLGGQVIGSDANQLELRNTANVARFVSFAAEQAIKFIRDRKRGVDYLGQPLPTPSDFVLADVQGDSFIIRNNPTYQYHGAKKGQPAPGLVLTIEIKNVPIGEHLSGNWKITRISYPHLWFEAKDTGVNLITQLTPAQLKLACDNLNNPNSD